MATLISAATGNFTAGTTFALCDATCALDSEAGSTATTTSYVASSTYTPGIISATGIVVKIASRVASPTGTFSVELYNVTGSLSVAIVTVNVSDISVGGGWYCFPITTAILAGATGYATRVKSSVTGEVTVYRDGTAGNWSRQIRTSTLQAPAANDQLICAGEHTGAGTGNSFTVTMDNTATTSFGPTVSGGPPQGMTVSKRCTVSYGVAGVTAYYLKLKGVLAVYDGGTFNIGTSGAVIPSGSSAMLMFDSVANVDSGLEIKPLGVFNAYGNPKWPTTAITAASNATPIEITSTSHGLVAGERVTIVSVGGNTAANGTWEVIASTGANTFTIGAINGAVGGLVGTSTGNAAYTAGGTWQRLAYTRLNSDEAAAQTVIGPVLSTSGWAASDELCFASTTQTATQCEKKTITTVDSSTQVTISAGLTNAHSGTSPTMCEIGNLTRNVKIQGISTSLQGYCYFQTTATVVCKDVEFLQLGSATSNKRGIDVTTTTGSCSITYCSIHDFIVTQSFAFNISGASSSNVIFSNNIVYNVANTHFNVAATTGTWTADGNLFCRSTDTGTTTIGLSDVGGIFTNNTVAGAVTTGIAINESASIGTFSGTTVHSSGTIGISVAGSFTNGAITNSVSWRNLGAGLTLTGGVVLTIANLTVFGNNTNNIVLGGNNILFTNLVSGGDTTFATATGISISGVKTTEIIIESGNLGTVAGIKSAHTQDIGVSGTSYATLILRNSTLASATQVLTPANLVAGSYIRAQRLGGTAGNHKTWTGFGTISVDTTIFDVSPQSARLTPNNASNKLATDGGSVDGKGAIRASIANAGTVTFSVRVRESVAGDGTAYNGARARLVLRKNVAAGIAADVVLATATSASNGAWETISGTTAAVTEADVLSAVVDVDGTTGWVNVDTAS